MDCTCGAYNKLLVCMHMTAKEACSQTYTHFIDQHSKFIYTKKRGMDTALLS